jgi:RHS repeat-associated protein
VMEDWTIAPPPPAERFSTLQINSPVEQIITDPRYPGLQIRIPPNTNIVGWDGVPKSRLAVERLDPDKLPVAAPPIKTKSVYQLYFGTPMGGIPSNPIPVTLPNDLGLEPGRQTPLWYYDGSPMGGTGEWKQGGTGTVSADGSVIIADAGSGIPRFCGVCGLPCFEAAQNEAPNPPCPDCDQFKQQYGKPVNLATGQELESAVDLVVDGEVPIVIRRVFNPFDGFAYVANFQQSLGVNWTIGTYDVAMLPFAGDYRVRMVMPGNSRVDFTRGADGRFRSGGYSTFDGAEMVKVGGTNASAFGALANGERAPDSAPLNANCFSYDGSFYLALFKDGRQWRFDAAPNATKIRINGGCLYFLTEMRDAQGRFVKIHRSDGKIQRIETSSGQWVNFGYGNGVVNSVTDNTGRTVSYSHEFVPNKGGFRAHGFVTGSTPTFVVTTEAQAAALGVVSIPPRRLTSATTPEGTYAYTYEDDPPSLRLGALSLGDGGGGAISTEPPTCQNVRGGTRLKTIQLPGITGVFTNFYGPSKRVLRQTWPDGTDIRFSYKVVGGCVPGLFSSTSQPTEGAPLSGGSNTTTCQGAGCIRTDSWDGDAVTGGTIVGIEVTDSRGKKFGQDFNSLGLATKVVDENGQELKVVRNGHRVTSMTDSLGRTTSYTYDARGNRTKIVDPAGRETNITYDPKWNKPTLVSRRLNETAVIEYRYSYDPSTGVLLTSTDPENNVKTHEYDANNRLARTRDALEHQTSIHYDGRGNVNRTVDALGNAIATVSDLAGRTVQMTDALGNETQASYNALNQLTKITDARTGETRFNFDSRNNLASVVNPLNNTIETYDYDTIGRVQSKTDAHLRSETYGYDGNGNLTSVTDRRNQVTTIGYDNSNRPARITFHDGTVQERTYDAAGRLTEIREGDSAQRVEYDILDRMTRVITETVAGVTSVAHEYDALDRRTKRTVAYPGGVLEETLYSFDKASRLTSITQNGVNGTQITSYVWDTASRLTLKTLPNGIRQQHVYDDANRLLSITYLRTDDTVIEQVSYNYDANGQRTVKTSGTQNLQETTLAASYDAANRMTSITLYPDTASAKTYALTYDDHGNLVQKQNTAVPSEVSLYTWDARNRLTGIAMSEAGQTSTAAFKYDAAGRRVERMISMGGVFQRTQYVYDGIQVIGELADGRLAATMLTGLNVDEVIARTVNVTAASAENPLATKSYLADALNSVLAMTLPNQNPEVFYSYSPYGETTHLGVELDNRANSNQYTARENDGVVGATAGGALYYYRARYYDPVLKRFIGEDPIGLHGGMNVYAYVGGDPIQYSDPMGLANGGGNQGGYRPGTPSSGGSAQNYTWKVFRCMGDCSERTMRELLCNPAPGVMPRRPTATGDVNQVVIGGYGLGPVTTAVNPNGMTIWNLTMPGHLLHPGWVRRDVIVEGGATWVVTTGGGTGFNPLNLSSVMAPFVWGGQSPIKNSLDECLCAKPQ